MYQVGLKWSNGPVTVPADGLQQVQAAKITNSNGRPDANMLCEPFNKTIDVFADQRLRLIKPEN